MSIFGRNPYEYLLDPAVERRVIRVRRHWAYLLTKLLQTLVVVVVAFVLSQLVGDNLWVVQSVLWYLAVAALLRFAWHALEWWIEVIIVTNKRFMISKGLIVTKISMMPITKVTDMSYLRSAWGRALGYGTLRVESAGQKQDLETVDYLPKPEAVFDAISELIFGEKKQVGSGPAPGGGGRVRSGMLGPLPRRRRTLTPGD